MKYFMISLTKVEILDHVSLNSTYMGAKGGDDSGFFERVRTIEDDDPLLSRFWIEMCGVLTDQLKEFTTSSSDQADILTLNFEVSGAFDESLVPSIKEDLFAAMAAGITARWFAYTLPDKAEDWNSQSRSMLARAVSKLCHRRRPSRPSQ